MEQTSPLTYEDVIPNQGLFSLEVLYLLQTVRQRQEHARYLLRLLDEDKRFLQFADESVLDPDFDGVRLEQERQRTVDHLYRVLGHLALAFNAPAATRGPEHVIVPHHLY